MPAPTALFAGTSENWPLYQHTLSKAFGRAGIDVNLINETDNPALVDYIIYAPNGPIQDFTPYANLKAVLSLWAGVESFLDNATLTVPLARMVDHGLSLGMAEWVLGHTMRYHLGMDAHLFGQDGIWRNETAPPLAKNRKVGILGLGELGQFAGEYLSRAGFQVNGWSRRQKDVNNITCFSGADGLSDILKISEILILLLPLTNDTTGIINADTLSQMPKGAFLINPGRGLLIDDDALLAALESKQIAHATLDVFHTEPLPADHPYWPHENVTVTPHIASETRAETASDSIAENIKRGEDGLSFLHLVDRTRGY